MATSILTARLPTPAGDLVAFARDGAFTALGFAESDEAMRKHLGARLGPVTFVEDPALDGLGAPLAAYLGGELGAIDGLPVDPGGTDFQRRVWAALRRIPVGTTTTYAAIARGLGMPGGSRAVGRANGQNPIAVVIPCHRVVASGGGLGGYAGGLARKRWLLGHERVLLQLEGLEGLEGPEGLQGLEGGLEGHEVPQRSHAPDGADARRG